MSFLHSEDFRFLRLATGLPSLLQGERCVRRRIILAMGAAVCNDLGLFGYLPRTLYTLRASPAPCAVVAEPTRALATSRPRLIPRNMPKIGREIGPCAPKCSGGGSFSSHTPPTHCPKSSSSRYDFRFFMWGLNTVALTSHL